MLKTNVSDQTGQKVGLFKSDRGMARRPENASPSSVIRQCGLDELGDTESAVSHSLALRMIHNDDPHLRSVCRSTVIPFASEDSSSIFGRCDPTIIEDNSGFLSATSDARKYR